MPKPSKEEIALAVALHKRVCRHDDSGACSWKYVSDPWSNSAYYDSDDRPYKYYLNRAKMLLKECGNSLKKANAILTAIFGSKIN